jgi:hypothetical protein
VRLSERYDTDRIGKSPAAVVLEPVMNGSACMAESTAFRRPDPAVRRAGSCAVGRSTAVRIDHVVTVDFARFGPVVDAIHGIDVPQGGGHLDGAAALVYVRPQSDADLGRSERQQDVLRAVFGKLASPAHSPTPRRSTTCWRSSAGRSAWTALPATESCAPWL